MTISLVGIAYLMAFIMYVLKLGGSLRGELKPLHKRLGIISLLMGFATILMGMTEKANIYTGWTLQFGQFIIGLVIGIALCITFSVIKFVDKKDGHQYKPLVHPTNDTTVQLI